MNKPIPYGRQDINQLDIDSVEAVLRSDFLTQGSVVPAFEKKVCEFVGVKYAVATNSATSALHIACLALSVGKNDLVWTTSITFVASANCAIYCGANVDFVDIDPRTYLMSVEKLEEKLKIAKENNCLPKVVIPVHLCGQSCEMDKIFELSKQYGFKIIEDASHAIGGKYKGSFIGNCKYSDITVFSFHPVKIITTGEGGMAVTNKQNLYEHMQRLRSHGITRDPNEMDHLPDGSWYYQQIELGYNYRLTDLQAALGLSQMNRIEEFVNRRNEIANLYNQLLSNMPFVLPWQSPDNYSSYHLYVIRVKNSAPNNHHEIFERLRARGILVNLHYIPLYHHPFYKKMGFDKNNYPESESYYSEAISLPIYSSLTDDDVKTIVHELSTPLNFQTIF
jgi:UDP-4-amino-4,6-dideoxy-N-acetyl-beta-L-altrosamine transaminase